jgi:hypothetical protein
MKIRLMLPIVLASLLFVSGSSQAKSAKAATPVDSIIWAHDLIYNTVLTTNSFKNPPLHTVDKLFNFGDSGLAGQRPVSESAPGDKDYNGGRWSVQLVTYTASGLNYFDPGGDGIADFEIKNAEMVLQYASDGYLTITDAEIYFSCPLRGKGK